MEIRIKKSKNLNNREEEKYFNKAKSVEQVESSTKREEIDTFLSNISTGKSYERDPNYLIQSSLNAIYPIDRIIEMSKNKEYNIISAKLIGEVNGTYLVDVVFERIMPLEKKSVHRK